MSLATQISALASAIGANIKALTTRVTAVESTAGIVAANVYTANRTATSADVGKAAQMNAATALTFTIDPTTLAVGSMGLVRQVGAGQVTVAVASGTLVKGGPTAKTAQQGSMISWRVDSSTLVYVNGEVAAT